MYDSQQSDYLDIFESLLTSRQQWEQVPAIVHLAYKAIGRLVQDHNESFLQHKMLINQQSLKIKEIELSLNDKIRKRDLQNQIASFLNAKNKQEEDSVSQFQKIVNQSRYKRQKVSPPTLEQLQTIAELSAKYHTDEARKEVKALENRLQTLKEEVKSRMVEIENERRLLQSECREAHSRIEQSQLRPFHTQADQKILSIEQHNRKMNQGLNYLVDQLEQNFLNKQQVSLLIEKERQKKSPPKIKSKELDKTKSKNESTEFSKELQKQLVKYKSQGQRQWIDFKQGVQKQISKMVSIDTINNMIDSFRKDMLEKYQSMTAAFHKLESKAIQTSKNYKDHRETTKDVLTKSQRRAQKRSSPSKSVEVIQSSLNRLQKTILEKQNSQIRRLERDVEGKISLYDEKLVKQLDRRERHLCQVIQQTYNQNLKINNEEDSKDIKGALKKLYQTNRCCRYLYIGNKECKKDSEIPWQKEALNNLVQNFVWKKDSSVVLASAPGLYRIEAGLYGEIDSQSYILINGEPIAQIKRPQKNRSTGVKVRGAVFIENVLLPGKSKVSVRVGQHFYYQAFLSLQLL